MILSATNALVRVLLAPPCAACGVVLEQPLAGAVCAACWRAVPHIAPPWCVRCGDPLPSSGPHCARCRGRPPTFVMARSAGVYEGSLRDIIHAFKYQRRRLLAEPLGALMREAGGDVLGGADVVVPVPLHPFRTWRRGFNQADDLARQLRLPVWPLLRRTRHGPPQAGQSASRRHANVRRAFALRRSAWIDRVRLRRMAVLLVDDVMTTGATIEACSEALIEAGIRRVGALTVARAVATQPVPRPPPRPLSADPRR